MDYAAGWPPPPQLPPQQHHHLYATPPPQLPPQQHHHLYATPPPPRHHLTGVHYPHPQPPPPLPLHPPYPNPRLKTIPSYSCPPPPPGVAAAVGMEAYPPNPYAPHGGYTTGPPEVAGGGGGSLAGYYYEGGFAKAPAVPTSSRGSSKKGSRSNNVVVPSAFCGVCKIDCNSQEVLTSHKQGKRHKKNLQKLQEAITPKPPKARMTPNPAVIPFANKCEQNKRKAVPDEEDFEMKKRKVLEGGAEPSEVKVCTVCNVVVNSQKVYESHVFGQKHAANLKKLQQLAANAAS